jgi:uncharacterized protein (TIGR03382 family)
MMMAMTMMMMIANQTPANWACDDARYGDDVCDCGCDALDSDCGSTEFIACARSNCTGTQVPWEHQNDQCMASTCGDGWRADNEACDDFNALASGGCNADCSAVNAGFTCGEGATGCSADNEGEGEPIGEGEGEGDDGGGCTQPSSSASFAGLAVVLLRRRRR